MTHALSEWRPTGMSVDCKFLTLLGLAHGLVSARLSVNSAFLSLGDDRNVYLPRQERKDVARLRLVLSLLCCRREAALATEFLLLLLGRFPPDRV